MDLQNLGAIAGIAGALIAGLALLRDFFDWRPKDVPTTFFAKVRQLTSNRYFQISIFGFLLVLFSVMSLNYRDGIW